jgi:hypothetical protein
MINFQNPQNLEIYNSFINEFGEILIEKNDISTINILGINLSHTLSNTVNILNAPFATNTTMGAFPIVMNEMICNDLNLTTRERFAMISHEIGHIIDSTPQKNNGMQREINADKFAIELGLAQDLKNGLQKIIDSNNYSTQVEKIEERIRILTAAQITQN